MNTLNFFGPMLITGLAGSFLLFCALWIVQVIRRDAGVVDIGWTVGVGAMAIYAAATGEGWLPRRILLACMGGIWSLRLAGYIFRNRIMNGAEDARYQRLRAHWSSKANAWFFLFFTSQSLLVALFALPFLPAAQNGLQQVSGFDFLALITWITAMTGEWIADLQLARFRDQPGNRGKVCREGLWNWSRHPNYFFEWLHWFAYVFLAAGAPGFGWSLVGPVAMYLFLMHITGVPHVERESLAKRGDAYREYQRTTRMLIPIPRKRKV